MRTVQGAVDYSAHERILADAIVDVATELRLADPTEFVLMIRGEQAANIADLVNSSSELFFKSGSLRYALAAGCDLRWEFDADRAARHGIPQRGGDRILSPDDRARARRRRGSRHPVRG